MERDPEQEYFADGVVEDIITALSRVAAVRDLAQLELHYKGRAVDVKQVGRELGVRYVMEGSVRKQPTEPASRAVIDAATGVHLWPIISRVSLDDIFALQDQVAERVVGRSCRAGAAEIERAKRKPTESCTPYDYYLRGMASFTRGTKNHRRALRLFYKAVGSILISHRLTRWRHGATSGAKLMAGWMIARRGGRRPPGWRSAPRSWAMTMRSLLPGRPCTRASGRRPRWRIALIDKALASIQIWRQPGFSAASSNRPRRTRRCDRALLPARCA